MLILSSGISFAKWVYNLHFDRAVLNALTTLIEITFIDGGSVALI